MFSSRIMSEEARKITYEEYELSIYKHECWETLNKYIDNLTEIEEKYPEFASSWINEFYDCNSRDDLHNFIKYFREKLNI